MRSGAERKDIRISLQLLKIPLVPIKQCFGTASPVCCCSAAATLLRRYKLKDRRISLQLLKISLRPIKQEFRRCKQKNIGISLQLLKITLLPIKQVFRRCKSSLLLQRCSKTPSVLQTKGLENFIAAAENLITSH